MVTRRRVQQPRPVPPPQSLLLLVVLSLLLALVWGPPGFDAFLLQPRFTTTATSSHGRISRSSTRAHRLMQMQMPVQTPALRPFHPTADTPADALPLVDHARVRAHGRHVCLDYTGFRVDAREGAEATLAAIRAAVGESGVREVHSRVVVLGEDGLSPPGFTGVCLVDESHVTAHCYSDRGWLAIDVFTCGAHPPEDIARGVHSRLLAAVPGLHLVRGVTLDRFLHHDLVGQLEGEKEVAVKAKAMAEAAK